MVVSAEKVCYQFHANHDTEVSISKNKMHPERNAQSELTSSSGKCVIIMIIRNIYTVISIFHLTQSISQGWF